MEEITLYLCGKNLFIFEILNDMNSLKYQVFYFYF